MLRLARPVSASLRRQLLAQAASSQRRTFAEKKDSILSSDPAFMPGSQSHAVPVKTEVPLGPGGPGSPAPNPSTPATPSSSSTIPPESVPLAPPSPAKVQTAPPTNPSSVSPAEPSPPPPSQKPTPPPPKKRFRRLRLLFYLLLLSTFTYGGAVWYALQSDNFHDFFTEYIPFGEDVVLYFEEQSFKKRFPNARHNVTRTPRQDRPNEGKVTTIPQKSGLSWRVAQESEQKGSDLTQKGKHMSALDANQPATPKEVTDAKQDPADATRKEKSVSVESAKKGAAARQESKSTDAPAPDASAKTAPPPSEPSSAAPSAKSDSRPPAVSPVTQISPLAVPNADEPVVQELVKIINDLITVVNSDSADSANRYSLPMTKAKESLESVASKITVLRDAERKAAEERIAEAHAEFDAGAKQLLHRIETAQAEDEARYREEFETERARLAQLYEEKVKTEVQRSTELAEQRLKNELAEQAIEMKRDFVAQIKSLVESEREGRLSKLSDLSTNVDNLTQLTSNWNGIIDANLATQKLQVAVDAVRSALDASAASDAKPRAFVREMAALKLVADGDAVVDAAIASINPAAYQKGIPSQPQLIDRFRRVASEVRKASLLPEDAGIASHAASLVLSRVLFKKHGQPTGSDVESILARTETMLEEGDLDGAAREMNSLDGWAKVLSRDWLGDVRKVLEVKQALEVIETEARLNCLRVE